MVKYFLAFWNKIPKLTGGLLQLEVGRPESERDKLKEKSYRLIESERVSER